MLATERLNLIKKIVEMPALGLVQNHPLSHFSKKEKTTNF